MGSAFALIGLLIRHGPTLMRLISVLMPILKEAAPLFKDFAKVMPEEEAAQKAVAIKAPDIYVSKAEEDRLYDRMIQVH